MHMPFPRMLSGHLQGLLLQMISRMIHPERILEIGTFTGYSAICLAQGLTETGYMDTIEINPELEERILGYFKEAGLSEKIRLHRGNALELLSGFRGSYDLCFIDADKEQYLTYYHLIYKLVRPGGFILVDNVLWGGKVLQEVPASDKEAQGVYQFNEYIKNDERIDRLLLPFRDGLMLLRKH